MEFSSFLQTSPYQVSRTIRDSPTFFIQRNSRPALQDCKLATFASELCNVGNAAGCIIQLLACNSDVRIFTHWFYFSFCIPGTNIMDRDWIKHRFSSQEERVPGGLPCRTECTKQIVMLFAVSVVVLF